MEEKSCYSQSAKRSGETTDECYCRCVVVFFFFSCQIATSIMEDKKHFHFNSLSALLMLGKIDML